MKLKQWCLLGICLVMLCSCMNTQTNDNSNDNTENKVDDYEVESMDNEVIDVIDEEEIILEVSEDEQKDDVKTNEIKNDSSNTEKKKIEESKKEDTVSKKEVEEDKPVDETEPVPTPTTPVDPPKDEPKEEPKIEEEIVYGGWHESDKAKKVFNKINSIREENGLSALPWNDSDTWLANTRVEELIDEVANGTVHSGLKKYDRYVGEIAGYGYSPNGVVNAWMQSSGHANQILADYNTSIAVGVYYDEYTASSYYIVIFR